MPDELEVALEETEIPDPGKTEGTKKDPRLEQDKITPDTPRFKEVYKNWKQAEERIAKLEANKGGDNSALIEEMRRHNASLEETIKQIGGNKADDKDDNALKALDDKLTELKALKRAAREKADFETETSIDDNILDLKVDIRELKKSIESAKTKSVKPSEKDTGLSDTDSADFGVWVVDNEWFNKDPKKRASAIAFEKKIITEPEFANASLSDVLEEVTKRVEEKWKPVTGTTQVESGRTLASSTSTKSIKLSKTEVDIANGLGIPVETYAKQKALMASRRS